MTTKVIVLCPDNSLHDTLVRVEEHQDDDAWIQVEEQVVPPREQSDPIYISSTRRIVVEENRDERVQPLVGGPK